MKLADAMQKAGLFADIADAPKVLARFDPATAAAAAQSASAFPSLLLTGEGSSRIFPAKQAIERARKRGDFSVYTAGSTEAAAMDLSGTAVLGASNSGRTAELVSLFRKLKTSNHPSFYALSANPENLLEPLARGGHVLRCGAERAVAATKSVVEQALFISTVVELRAGRQAPDPVRIADAVREALLADIPSDSIEKLAKARTAYFSGMDDGVAEELALKCNEILRKPSRFLEGTFLLHGVEEVMGPEDALVVVSPFEGSEEKIRTVLGKTGIAIVGIGASEIDGVRVDASGESRPYALLAAGWLLLGFAGLRLGIDVDHPVRARKIGNEDGK